MAYIGTPPANRPLTSFDIGENNITSFNISEAVIETLDIVNGSVTEDKLAANAVTTAKMADASITSAKLAVGFGYSHGHPLAALSGNVSVEQLPNVGITAGTYGNATSIPAVTVNSKGQVTAVSNVAVAGGFSNMTVYTSNATWTVPAGVTRCKVTAVGAGAGGADSVTYNSAGGGAGGTSIGYITVVAGQTASVVVGIGGLGGRQTGQVGTATSGGNTIFTYSGTTLFAEGGLRSTTSTAPASGGTATGGTLNIKGGDGGGSLSGASGHAGPGGASSLGGNGAAGGESYAATNGTSGGGGGGASGYGGWAGNGGDGIVIIEY